MACTSEIKIAFVAWRRLSRRTTLMCKALNADLWFFPDRLPYLRAAYRTFAHVRKYRPSVLLIQLPQGPLLLETLLLRLFFGCRVVADVHTGFLMQWEWKSYLLNAPFRPLLKSVDHVLIHNGTMNELLSQRAKAKAVVVYDPWQFIEPIHPKQGKGDYLVFPASYHPDEPLTEILSVLRDKLPQIRLYVTGNWKRNPSVKRFESINIIFTGFLSDAKYEELIAGARGIVSGTKEEYTALMSSWEALAYKKPLAITESRALRECYGSYPVYYDWKDQESIIRAINMIFSGPPDFATLEKLREATLNNLNKFMSLVLPNESD